MGVIVIVCIIMMMILSLEVLSNLEFQNSPLHCDNGLILKVEGHNKPQFLSIFYTSVSLHWTLHILLLNWVLLTLKIMYWLFFSGMSVKWLQLAEICWYVEHKCLGHINFTKTIFSTSGSHNLNIIVIYTVLLSNKLI